MPGPTPQDKKNNFVIRDENQFQETGNGPLNVLTKSPYDFSKTQYPENLSSVVPSYVIFYINLPESSKFTVKSENFVEGAYSVSDQNIALSRGTNLKLGREDVSGRVGTTLGAITGAEMATSAVMNPNFQTVANPVRAGFAAVNAGGAVAGTGLIGGAISGFAEEIVKKPRYQRIKEAIAIYMPDTIMHTYSHDYDVQSATQAFGKVGLAQRAATGIGEAVTDTAAAVKNFFTGEGNVVNPNRGAGFDEALASIAEKTGLVGPGFTDFALRSKGLALNPQVELLYKGTANRSFILDFKFQPRSKKETEVIKNIIFKFRRYAAPTLASTAAETGAYFIPPGQFDIQYYFKNEENRYIGKISTCVLENIDVNYSSAGVFATFDDGAPVEINMQLRFKEVDILTREMIDQGF